MITVNIHVRDLTFFFNFCYTKALKERGCYRKEFTYIERFSLDCRKGLVLVLVLVLLRPLVG